ncbi:hypothetical protein ALC56_08501 [Trachymyrmex septentrionalis]|uniref:Uncharacterized protein n=1 Tax=Trachymyrmex septentrionalis TaxID=34720 RepID=A0A195F7X1_9HYME|nr:hypothetical protein ALC56_08501 [Trachymyrmex septentrionalis]
MTTAPIGAAPRRGTPIDASMGLSRGFNRIMKMTRDELAKPDNQ